MLRTHVGKAFLAIIAILSLGRGDMFADDNIYGKYDREVFEFRFERTNPDFSLDYKKNNQSFSALIQFVKIYESRIRAKDLFVIIYGFSSSSDDIQSNFKLATERNRALKEALIRETGLPDDHFIVINRPRSFALSKDLSRVMLGKRESVLNLRQDRMLNPQTYELEYIPLLLPNSEEKVSLRFNMLHWLAAAPNLGLEWRPYANLGFSINGTLNLIETSKDMLRYKLYIINPEARYYWSKNRRAYFGLGAHASVYNIKLSEEGMQGFLLGGGFTGGYKIRLRPKLDLDLTLGLGYSFVDYTPYYFDGDSGIMKEETKKFDYFGVTQLGVTLVWKLF